MCSLHGRGRSRRGKRRPEKPSGFVAGMEPSVRASTVLGLKLRGALRMHVGAGLEKDPHGVFSDPAALETGSFPKPQQLRPGPARA